MRETPTLRQNRAEGWGNPEESHEPGKGGPAPNPEESHEPGKGGPAPKQVLAALDRLLQHLLADPECMAWLASRPGSDFGRDTAYYAGHVGQADIAFKGNKNRIGGVTPPPKDVGGSYITLINNNGAFFGDVAGTQAAFAGLSTKILSGGPKAQEFVLLHELAHAVGVIGLDFDSDTGQAANNAEIEKHCSKTIQSMGK